MKTAVMIVAALMVGGSALAQTTSDPYAIDDPYATDTTVTSDLDTTTTDTTTATGVGGPYQPTTTAMGAASSKGGYPPCDPGPGDDNCIQLYEAGVDSSTNLAMNRNLGEGSTMLASADTTSGATPSNWTNDRSEEHTSELQSLMRNAY